jgi:hypothetical protein
LFQRYIVPKIPVLSPPKSSMAWPSWRADLQADGNHHPRFGRANELTDTATLAERGRQESVSNTHDTKNLRFVSERCDAVQTGSSRSGLLYILACLPTVAWTSSSIMSTYRSTLRLSKTRFEAAARVRVSPAFVWARAWTRDKEGMSRDVPSPLLGLRRPDVCCWQPMHCRSTARMDTRLSRRVRLTKSRRHTVWLCLLCSLLRQALYRSCLRSVPLLVRAYELEQT